MSQTAIVMAGAEILQTELEKFDFSNPPTDPIELSHTLSKAVIEHEGMGLAANQLGLPYRAFVIRSSPMLVIFNPIVVDISTEMVYLEEGCLSYPGLSVKIKRPKAIRVRYTQPNGEIVTRSFNGLTARVFLHELDHLNGITHIDRATGFHKEQALKNIKKDQNPLRVAKAQKRASIAMSKVSTALETNQWTKSGIQT
jgi:peptide deformylase